MLKYMAAILACMTLLGAARAQDEKPLKSVVVAGFANKTGEQGLDWVNQGLRTDLTRRLLRIKELVVSDTPGLARARNELGLCRKDLSVPEEAAKMGRALGVEKVVIGQYTKAPTGVKVVVRFLDVASGEVSEPGITRTGPPISIAAGLALDIAKALDVTVDDADAVTENLTSNSDAYEKYCKGLLHKDAADAADEDGRKDNLSKATDYFILATRDDKQFAAPYYELGWLFVIADPPMYEYAAKQYKKAISFHPEYAEAHNNLGVVQAQMDESQSALKSYTTAIKLVPNYVDAHFNLGRLYDTLGQYDKAIEEYRQVIKLTPYDAVAHNNLAVSLLSKKENDEALKSYQRALELKPDLKEAHLGLGLIYDNRNEKKMALDHYRKFVDLGGYDEDINARIEKLKKDMEERE
jgi:tetratricopeptide (TPR) repeat protein/TolB-like protein